MRFTWILAILLFSASSLSAQPNLHWSGRYGGEDQDWVYSIVQTTDNGYVMAGLTYSFGQGQSDFYLLKINEEGQEQWFRTFGGESYELCNSLLQLDDGFSLAGYTTSFGAGNRDFYFVRTDEEGEELWSRTYGGERWDSCSDHIAVSDGGFILIGRSSSFDERRSGIYIVKTDNNGNEEWSNVLYHDVMLSANSIVNNNDSTFSISGVLNYREDDRERDLFLLKIDDNGNELWLRTFGTEEDDIGYDHIKTNEGGYALVGYSHATEDGYSDIYVVKTNPEGEETWSDTYGNELNDFGFSILQLPDHGYVIGSTTQYINIINDTTFYRKQDFYLLRIDSTGNEVWSQVCEHSLENSCYSLIRTTDGGYALGGMAQLGGPFVDVYFVKTEPDPLIAPPALKITLPDHCQLLTCSPNPFNSTTTIKYTVTLIMPVVIEIFDVKGRLVETLVDGIVSVGRHSVVWDASGVGAGVYMLRMKDEGGRRNGMGKMILIK